MMRLIAPSDAVWLWAETANAPMHVIGLQIFRSPADAPADLLDRLYVGMTDSTRLDPRFRYRPYRSWRTGGQYAWHADERVDLTDHVIRATLPAPGDDRELLEHISGFHSEQLEHGRPLWRVHLIDGLSGGRFALCTKLHHALFDGVATSGRLFGGLSPEPTAHDCATPWQVRRTAPPGPPGASGTATESSDFHDLLALPRVAAASATAVAKAVASTLAAGGVGLPYAAPPSPFNGEVGAARRFVSGSWPIARLRAVARAAQVSSNDVLLAMCGGALRSYLAQQGNLPAAELTAMVPVSRRASADDATGGNNVAAVLCPLATDEADPARRLARVHATMRDNKALMGRLDPVSAAAVSAAALGPVLAANSLPVPLGPCPPFNLVISNVPGSNKSRYLDGCELLEVYPASVVSRGQGLNITVMSYAGELAFGLTGCNLLIPDLASLLDHLGDALTELETAYGTRALEGQGLTAPGSVKAATLELMTTTPWADGPPLPYRPERTAP